MGLRERIKALRKKKNLSQAELADLVGVKSYSVADWEQGRSEPSIENLNKLAVALECEAWEFMGSPAILPGWVVVPVIGRVPAGVPLEAIEEFDGEILVPERETKGKKIMALRIRGKSMEPRLFDGDAVVIQCDIDPNNGDTVVIRVNLDGDVSCKKFYRSGDSIVLQPENTDFEPIILGPGSSGAVHVIGKVIGLYRKMG